MMKPSNPLIRPFQTGQSSRNSSSDDLSAALLLSSPFHHPDDTHCAVRQGPSHPPALPMTPLSMPPLPPLPLDSVPIRDSSLPLHLLHRRRRGVGPRHDGPLHRQRPRLHFRDVSEEAARLVNMMTCPGSSVIIKLAGHRDAAQAV